MHGYYGLTILEAEDRKNTIKSELELAELYAEVSNKAWTVEDDVYDFKEGTKQHAWAVEHSHRWFTLYHQLQEEIFAILKKEGVQIPETKRIEVLRPFMKRNGYDDRDGWWIKSAP